MADKLEYVLDKSDLERCVKFSVDMYLKTGGSASRTTGQTRGLGTMINDWLGGKAVEIGVKKILETFDGSKELVLDFSIHEGPKIENDPDIVKVKEKGQERDPLKFVEIKNFGENNRWIGLSKNQFVSISGRVRNTINNAYLVYAYLEDNVEDMNKRQDLLGAFLKIATKEEYSSWFEQFVTLGDIKIKIALVMTLQDLQNYGTLFYKASDYVYETDIFKESNKSVDKLVTIPLNGGEIPRLKYMNYDYPSVIGPLLVKGTARMYMKQNRVNKTYYLKCIEDVSVENKVLGKYQLSKGKVYKFDFGPTGRNPEVFQDSIWIAARNAMALFGSKVEPVIEGLIRAI